MFIRECVYEVVATDQGEVLIAECTNSNKVVAIYFLENDIEEQMDELQSEWPTVDFKPGSPTQRDDIIRSINSLDTSIKINSFQKANTGFAMAVYNAISNIPKGETRSYSQLATEIGNPGGTRAVAGACARNNLAYIVPCHRVIGNSGTLSGYRWGVAKKRRLLEAEGAELNFAAM